MSAMVATTPLVHLVDNDPKLLRAVGRLLGTAGISTTQSTSAAAFRAQFDNLDYEAAVRALDIAIAALQAVSPMDATTRDRLASAVLDEWRRDRTEATICAAVIRRHGPAIEQARHTPGVSA